MIVSKFGGTSVGTAEAIRRLVEIARGRQREGLVVVVSALAGITDALLALETVNGNGNDTAERFTALIDRHLGIARELSLPASAAERVESEGARVLEWLAVRAGRPWTAAERDYLVGHGELWSSILVAAAINRAMVPTEWVDARTVITTDDTFGKAIPLVDEIRVKAQARIAPIVAGGTVVLTQGFIGATVDGTPTTLGRGGSDYSASLLGAALSAERVEIWTDVDGVLTADPRIVPHATLLPEVSYHEAAELAAFGAKVLHPATQLPLIDAAIPCLVLNSFFPERTGTKIVPGAQPIKINGSPVRSIAWKKGITIINVRAPRRLGAVEFLQQLFAVFALHRIAVDVLASSEVNISVTVDATSDVDPLVRDLMTLGAVTVYERRAIVAVIGMGLREMPGLSARIFQAISKLHVEMISQGASEINVTFVVREQDGPTAVRALHDEFFGPSESAASARAS